MTDLPELIANVYRACGMEVEVSNADEGVMSMWNDGRLVYVEGDETFPLAPFVRDIVPTLNERGWEVNILQEMAIGKYWAQIFEANYGAQVTEISAPSPVEACFRAAWEALRPSESPSAHSRHPSA